MPRAQTEPPPPPPSTAKDHLDTAWTQLERARALIATGGTAWRVDDLVRHAQHHIQTAIQMMNRG